jgi:phage baseplate assembly protein gpV
MELHFGFVVDNNDPLKIGRCKVKIIGLYDSIKNEDLPWIQSMVPVNHELIFPPAIGSQVVCTSLDEYKQVMLILGIVPGIDDNTDTPDNNTRSVIHYPTNRSLVTASGHVLEFDDTEQGEEVNIIHSNKVCYIKMKADGDVVIGGTSINLKADATVNIESPEITVDGNVNVFTGQTGTFSTVDYKTITVTNGIITEII